MFTRFKIAIGVTLFVVFYLFLSVFLGSNGVLYHRALKTRMEEMTALKEKKEAEISILKERGNHSDSNIGSGFEVLYSFDEEEISFIPPSYDDSRGGVEYFYFPYWAILLLSFVLTSLYFLFLYLFGKLKTRRIYGRK